MLAALLHGPFVVFIVQALLILGCSRLVGLISRGLGQPMVIAEVVTGIMLGPSLLGWLAPSLFKAVFPTDSMKILQMFSQFGLIVFMFLIGLELDAKLLRGRGRASLFISQAGIYLPFALGVGLSFYFYPKLAPAGVRFLPFTLFLGIAMSVTAFPVLARILSERRLLRTKIGAVAIACAAFDDVAAWCLLAIVVSVVKSTGMSDALMTVVYTALYTVGMLLVVRPFMRRFAEHGSTREALTQNIVAATFVLLLLSSWATELIGIHALFGAFLFGTIIPKESGFATLLADKLEDFAVVVLLPLFFAYSGLRTQLGLLDSAGAWLLCGLTILVATLGKFGGSMLAARLTGLGWRESSALGILMNTRGLMELVVLNLGLDLGVISPQLFAMLVLMALVTTFMTTPVLQLIYPLSELATELAPSETSEAASPQAAFCALLAVSYTSAAGGMVVLAEALVRRTRETSRIYALKLLRPTERTSHLVGETQSAPEVSRAPFGPMLAQAQERKLALRPISFVSTEPARDICNVAESKGADLVLLGWHRPLFSHAALGGTVNKVFAEAASDVGVLVDRGLTELRRILVPFLGTPDDRAALSLAQRLSDQSGVEVTVLHVVPPGRGEADRLGMREQVSAVFFREPPPGEAGADPGSFVSIKVVEDSQPAEAALAELTGSEEGARPHYDLVLVGVGSDWGLTQRQFGINQEYFVRKCPTSLLVVHAHQRAAAGPGS